MRFECGGEDKHEEGAHIIHPTTPPSPSHRFHPSPSVFTFHSGFRFVICIAEYSTVQYSKWKILKYTIKVD